MRRWTNHIDSMETSVQMLFPDIEMERGDGHCHQFKRLEARGRWTRHGTVHVVGCLHLHAVKMLPFQLIRASVVGYTANREASYISFVPTSTHIVVCISHLRLSHLSSLTSPTRRRFPHANCPPPFLSASKLPGPLDMGNQSVVQLCSSLSTERARNRNISRKTHCKIPVPRPPGMYYY